MLIQISFSYDLQRETFLSFFSTVVLLYQDYHACMKVSCSDFTQLLHAAMLVCHPQHCVSGWWVYAPLTPAQTTGTAVASSLAVGLPAQPVLPCLGCS